jgi:hypothetical protein
MSSRLSVQIDRYVEAYQPGIIECSFIDAYGVKHLIIEKMPYVTDEDLWWNSVYPRPGSIECQIVKEFTDQNGDRLVRVDTELLRQIQSTTGTTQFVVHRGQVQVDGGMLP